MAKYQKGTIYKIVCKDKLITDSYVGSTCSFSHRRCMHKKTTINKVSHLYNIPLYAFIRNNGGWDNFDMIIIENYPCTSRIELLTRERHYYDELKPSLNVNMPMRSTKEYNSQPHRMEQARRKSKLYYNNNKQKVLNREKSKRINKIKCFCGSSVIKVRYEKHRLTRLHFKKQMKKIARLRRYISNSNSYYEELENLQKEEFNKICERIDRVLIKN